MKERKTDWIHIQQPDKKNMICSPEYLKKLLGIEGLDVYNIYQRITALEGKVQELEIPRMKQDVVNLLENGEKHNRIWIQNRVVGLDWYRSYKILRELVTEGKLTLTKSGAQDMYSIKVTV